MKWYTKVIKNYTNFNGRARRQEYWMFTLFNLIFFVVVFILDWILGTKFPKDSVATIFSSGAITAVYQLFVFLPGLAVTIRRLHDTGKSGALAVIMMLAGYAVGFYTHFAVSQSAIRRGDFAGSGIIGLLVGALILGGVGIWMLVLLCTDGTRGVNAYGPNPKEDPMFSFDQQEKS